MPALSFRASSPRLVLLAALIAALLACAAPASAGTSSSVERSLSHGFVAVSGFGGCAITDDGAVHCWGANSSGQLGLGDVVTRGDNPGELPAPAVPLGGPARSLSAGGAFTPNFCALLEDRTVHCWGDNGSGALGLGDVAARGDAIGELPTAAVPLSGPAKAVSSGNGFSCALLEDSTVHCWGANSFGQLGLGDLAARGDGPGELPTPAVPLGRPATAISVADFSACALLDDATVHCWGNNNDGNLGLGDLAARGDDPGELPTAAVPLAGPAIAISSHGRGFCALLQDRTVHCWGGNGSGQLGLGDIASRGDAPGELPTPAVPLGRPAIAVSGSDQFTNENCALLDDESIRCWGDNGSGQLGLGDVAARGDAPGELPTPAVPLGQPVDAVFAAPNGWTCASLRDGTVRCWGINALGRLGLGDVANRGDGPGEIPTAAVPLGGRVRRAGDLSLAVAASASSVHVGDALTLTYTLSGAGPDTTAGIVVGLGLPGLSVVSATPSQGSFDAASQSWSAGSMARGASATLAISAVVTTAGALAPGGEILAADALDDDSTPANGVAAEDDRASVALSASAVAPAPITPVGPAAKHAVDGLTLGSKASRDRSAPYRFALSGRLVALSSTLRDACKGQVRIAVKRGAKTVVTKTAQLKLNRTDGSCRYAATVTLPRKAAKGTYSASVSFSGNSALLAKTGRRLSLRAG